MKALIISFLLISTTLFANIAKVTAINGEVFALREDEKITLTLHSLISQKDIIETASNSKVQLLFNDQTIISIGNNSVLKIEEYFFDINKPKESKVLFDVNKGIFKTITGQIGKINPSKFKLKTKSANIGIRGTIYFVDVKPGEREVYSCTEGIIEVVTPKGTVIVKAGFQTVIEFGKPPTTPTPITKEQKQKLEKRSGGSDNKTNSSQKNSNSTKKDEKKDEESDQKTDDGNSDQKTDDGNADQQTDDGNSDQSNNSNNTTNNQQNQNNTTNNTTNNQQNQNNTQSSLATNTNSNSTTTSIDLSNTNNTVTNTKETSSNDTTETTITKDPVDDDTDNNSGDSDTENNFYTIYPVGTYSPRGSSTQLVDGNSYYENLDNDETISITDGKLGGSYTLNRYQYLNGTETTYDKDQDNVDDTLTINFNGINIGETDSTYTGYSEISSRNVTSLKGTTFSLHADSMRQFFVYQAEIKEQDYQYELNVVFGEKSASSDLPSDGISYYKDVNDHSSSNNYADTNGSYINWKSKNLLTYNLNRDELFIVIGDMKEDTTSKNMKLEIDFYRTDNTYNNSLNAVTSSDEFYVFGSQYQGWGGTLFVEDQNSNRIQYSHGEFRDLNFAGENSKTPTTTSTFTGFINSDSNLKIAEPFSVTLDRQSTISSTFDINNKEFKFTASLGTQAAYITDDTFAVINNMTYDGVDVDGWMLAVDTGDTANDNISWGFWGADLNNKTNHTGVANADDYASAWIAIDESIDKKITDIYSHFGRSTALFEGSMLGVLTDGSTKYLIDPAKSEIKLDFDFSKNTTEVYTKINGYNFNSNINKDGNLNTSASRPGTYTIEHGSDKIIGSFYDAGKKTIGSFNLIDNTKTAKGVFKATKQ